MDGTDAAHTRFPWASPVKGERLKPAKVVFFLLLLWFIPVCAQTVPITLLHLNDLSEIGPVQGGRRGGLARVATIRKQLLAVNPHTITILGGDALSPSALGTAVVDGQPLAGRQMVAVMNAVGFDYATFGNHEFDIPQEQFQQRLKESRFQWFSSNVTDASGKPFAGVLPAVIFTVPGEKGAVARVGMLALTLDMNPQPWVRYRDAFEAAAQQVRELRPKVDILIAVTHLHFEQDQQLAAMFPAIDLIVGGHEHENIQAYRGERGTPIFKADANARSVYVINLLYDTQAHRLRIEPHLQPIGEDIPEDPETARLVSYWSERGYAAFRAAGFDPQKAVGDTAVALDGRESSVRNRPTLLTNLIAQAMLREVPEAGLAIFNAGSIRLDDILPPGPVTQYDVIRVLPFGGKVLSVEIKGSLLQRILNQGDANRGSGGYLHTAGVSKDANGQWTVAVNSHNPSAGNRTKPLDPERTYKVAISEFLMTGHEQNLSYLTAHAPGVGKIKARRDIRLAVMDQLRSADKSTPVSVSAPSD